LPIALEKVGDQYPLGIGQIGVDTIGAIGMRCAAV